MLDLQFAFHVSTSTPSASKSYAFAYQVFRDVVCS